jgi:hypothetical protein
LNYFNYFTEIEDVFIRRRGKHLLLSSMDWALIESWKEMRVPLHVALRGIEKAFDSWEAKPRKRTVKTLLYCQEEVEAQYAEWLESRVGAASEETQSKTEPESEAPFSRAVILDHLRQTRAKLMGTVAQRKIIAAGGFLESLERAAGLLEDLENDFAESARPDAQKLEISLTGIERMLESALRSAAPAEQIDAIRKEVRMRLRPYRSHMDQAVYEQTLDNLLLKRLREQFGVPRLSLFYL